MIIKFRDLPAIRRKCHDQSIVLVGGVFDLLHRGHIAFLREVHKLGNIVVVALANDARVRERKGVCRPVLRGRERAIIVDAIRHVDYVFVSPRPSPQRDTSLVGILEALRPEIVVVSPLRLQKVKHLLVERAVKVIVMADRKEKSTTRIISSIIRCHSNE